MFEDDRIARNRKAWEGVPSAVAMRQGSAWPEHVASLPGQPAIDLTEPVVGVVDVNIEPQVVT